MWQILLDGAPKSLFQAISAKQPAIGLIRKPPACMIHEGGNRSVKTIAGWALNPDFVFRLRATVCSKADFPECVRTVTLVKLKRDS
jgi:hypothetical protein